MVLEAGALTTVQVPGTAHAGGEGLTKGWQRRGRVASDRRSGDEGCPSYCAGGGGDGATVVVAILG